MMECGDLSMPGGQALVERHRRHCAGLARIMADLGDNAFLDGPPFVTRHRGVNVTRLDGEVRAELTREGDTVTDWRGGAVVPWPQEDLDRLLASQEAGGSVSVDVLYLDADRYEAFVSSTTPAQQERDFAVRLAAAKAPAGAGVGDPVADHVTRLEIEQLVYLRGLRDLFAALGQTSVAEQIEPLVRDGVLPLMEALRRIPTGLLPARDEGGPEEGDVLGRLLALEQSVQESADLFAHLAPPEWLELRPDWEDFLTLGNRLPELTRLHRPA
jgi:hypothetical protein